MTSVALPTSSITAGNTGNAINSLSISAKLHLMSSTQVHSGCRNEYAHTHSDSASTRRTTQQTQRMNGGNQNRSFYHIMAQSTFDQSENSGPAIKPRKAGKASKTPITSYQNENRISASKNSNFSGRREAHQNRVPFGERAASNGRTQNVKRPSTATTQKQTMRGTGTKQFMAMTQSRRNKMLLV